jgi:FlaA1/EpsC-like NDP-sugar epimerase
MLARRRAWMMFLLQTILMSVALVLALLLRFDFALPRASVLVMAVPILVALRWAALFRYKLNHTFWRYTGIGDMGELLKAVLLGSLMFFAVLRYVCRIHVFPISVYVIEGMLSFLFLAGLRVGARMILQARCSQQAGEQVPVLIVGAGAAAALLVRELERLNYRAIGLVDDDRLKKGTKIYGVPVLGPINEIPTQTRNLGVREILIAVPSATGAQMLRITDFCARAGVPFRAVPGLADLIEGKVTISELRAVNLDDLLERDPVRLDADMVSTKLSGRVVMVTGAAGSIGSELCKQIVRCQPKKLICVDQAETPLFNLQQHVLAGSKMEIVYSVTDITDTERMRRLLFEHQVGVIFHAAAYKHVPMTEANPHEGLRNNVFGLVSLVETAEECGCEDFLLVSTDKAVKPTSLMGCTKRLGEMIVGSREPSRMRCVSVRFGNVLGSQGSVVPVFQEQIRSRGYITVTHPEMTRYFMTIPEAVSLVLQAFTVGEHGNILVLDMGKPVRILDLAKTLIRISGKRQSDVQIVFTGMRPGEKLHEELFYDSEVRLSTPLAKVMRAQSQLPAWQLLSRRLQELQIAAYDHDGDRIRAKLKQIVPEYQWTPETPATVARAFAALPGSDSNLQERANLA